MELKDPEIKKLKKLIEKSKEEFEIVICSFQFWKRLYENRKNENWSHKIMRSLFFRECILGITRIWDQGNNKTSLSLIKVKNLLDDKRIINVIIKSRIDSTLSIINQCDEPLRSICVNMEKNKKQQQEENVNSEVKQIKYSIKMYDKCNELYYIIDKLRYFRNNLIAHRNISFQNETPEISNFEKIYEDTSDIVEKLLWLIGDEHWSVKQVEKPYIEEAMNI